MYTHARTHTHTHTCVCLCLWQCLSLSLSLSACFRQCCCRVFFLFLFFKRHFPALS